MLYERLRPSGPLWTDVRWHLQSGVFSGACESCQRRRKQCFGYGPQSKSYAKLRPRNLYDKDRRQRRQLDCCQKDTWRGFFSTSVFYLFHFCAYTKLRVTARVFHSGPLQPLQVEANTSIESFMGFVIVSGIEDLLRYARQKAVAAVKHMLWCTHT